MKLLGPVFWYDLVRVARRQRLAAWRAVYAAGLLVALYVLYVQAFPRAGLFWGQYVQNGSELAAFATTFFGVFALMQFAAVILITPALAANAVAEERSN